jgi:hypothetical protein
LRIPLATALALAAGLTLTCLGTREPEDVQRRQLDHAQLELRGTAVSTDGPTSDSRGVRIGPGPGSVTLRLPSDAQIDPNDPFASVLIAGQGSTLVGSERVGLDREFRWVSARVEGGTSDLDAGTDPIVVVAIDDDSSVVELADVQVPLRDPGYTCSVSTPGR